MAVGMSSHTCGVRLVAQGKEYNVAMEPW